MISLILLLLAGAHWSVLKDIPTVLALLVYATPSVTLAAQVSVVVSQ